MGDLRRIERLLLARLAEDVTPEPLQLVVCGLVFTAYELLHPLTPAIMESETLSDAWMETMRGQVTHVLAELAPGQFPWLYQ